MELVPMIKEEDIRLVALALQVGLGLKSVELPSVEDLVKERDSLSTAFKGDLRGLLSKIDLTSLKNWLVASLLVAQADPQTFLDMASGSREEKILVACASFLKRDPALLSLFRSVIERSDDVVLLATLLLLTSIVQDYADDKLIGELEKWLEWPDVHVRISAVKLLSGLVSKNPAFSERILEDLLRAFERDPNRRVRESIATQLGVLASENTTLKRRLYSLLLSMFKKERSARVRKAILDSLLALT